MGSPSSLDPKGKLKLLTFPKKTLETGRLSFSLPCSELSSQLTYAVHVPYLSFTKMFTQVHVALHEQFQDAQSVDVHDAFTIAYMSLLTLCGMPKPRPLPMYFEIGFFNVALRDNCM